jgi:hypothetical protein
MHRSRLAGFIIDCHDTEPQVAATFWSQALGMPAQDPYPGYAGLDAAARDLAVEVQDVTHESRVHLDIEADDVDAEVTRLERLGAKRIAAVKTWWVLEAPTGHRFCVVRAKRSLEGAPGATLWP